MKKRIFITRICKIEYFSTQILMDEWDCEWHISHLSWFYQFKLTVNFNRNIYLHFQLHSYCLNPCFLALGHREGLCNCWSIKCLLTELGNPNMESVFLAGKQKKMPKKSTFSRKTWGKSNESGCLYLGGVLWQ